eukprot:COSAG01_NODE_3567_length_5925_cov_14.275318_4_plen_54_part_00
MLLINAAGNLGNHCSHKVGVVVLALLLLRAGVLTMFDACGPQLVEGHLLRRDR